MQRSGIKMLFNLWQSSIVFGLSVHLSRPSLHPSVRPSVCHCCGHSIFVILIRFLPNSIYGLLSSNSRSSSNTGFVLKRTTRWPRRLPLPTSIRCRGHSNKVILNRFLPNFIIKLSFKFVYRFCLTNDNQDG